MSDGKISRYLSEQSRGISSNLEFMSSPINLTEKLVLIFDDYEQLRRTLKYIREGKNIAGQRLDISPYHTARGVIVNGEPMKLFALVGEVILE